jgi:hypothetical protein
MMDILCAIVLVPAATFLVFAVALGAKSPLRWAAWGAICGPVAFACMIASEWRPQVASGYGHDPVVTYSPTDEQPPHKPNPFADLIPQQPAKDAPPGLY